jgi:hypothetical protein
MVILLFPIGFISYWTGYPGAPIIPQLSDILMLCGLTLLGFIVIYSGVIIYRMFREMRPFLAKGGEPIHSASVWKKGIESGLFLTSCERVVSINQASRATAHVGYRLVPAERATCSECNLREGKAILDRVAHERESYFGI